MKSLPYLCVNDFDEEIFVDVAEHLPRPGGLGKRTACWPY